MEMKIEYKTSYSNFDQLLINGQWRHGKGEKILRDLNPYDGSTLVEIPHANCDDMNEAYLGAAEVQHEWAALIPGERAVIMRRAAQIMEVRREEIVSWIIHESGGTRIKANLE